jgi:hypothetical protein
MRTFLPLKLVHHYTVEYVYFQDNRVVLEIPKVLSVNRVTKYFCAIVTILSHYLIVLLSGESTFLHAHWEPLLKGKDK